MPWVVCRTGGCPWQGEPREVTLRVPLGPGLHAELEAICACGTPTLEVQSPAAARLAASDEAPWPAALQPREPG